MSDAEVKKFIAGTKNIDGQVLSAGNMFAKITASTGDNYVKGNDNTDKVEYITYGPFIGNEVLQMAVTTAKVLGEDRKKVDVSFTQNKAKAGETIQALDQGQVLAMLGNAEKLAKGLVEFKKTQGDYEKISKETGALADTIMKSADKISSKKENDEASSAALKEIRSIVQSNIRAMNSLGQKGPALAFSTVKAMADYASASMRNLQEAAAK